MQIVLARLDEGFTVVKTGRTDLGERPTVKTVKVPVSLMWVNKGNDADLFKAQQFAQREGYVVFCYTDEKDPLSRARTDVARERK